MSEKKRIKYTIMVIPDDNGMPFSFKVSGAIIKAFAFFFTVLLAGLALLMFRAADIGVRLQLVSVLREENMRLKEQNQKLFSIAKKINSIEHLSSYLRRIAAAVKVNGSTAYAPDGSVAAQENIFNADSMDNLLDEIRFSESQHYKEVSDAETAPEMLLGSIPNIRPVEGWITKAFNENPKEGTQQHLGVDFAASKGALIRATAPGTVDEVFNDKYFGLMVTIQHSYGFQTRYGHCLQVLVSRGNVVERGQAIALVGNTGQSTGPHLHYEVIRNGKHIDPVKLMLSNAVLP